MMSANITTATCVGDKVDDDSVMVIEHVFTSEVCSEGKTSVGIIALVMTCNYFITTNKICKSVVF